MDPHHSDAWEGQAGQRLMLDTRPTGWVGWLRQEAGGRAEEEAGLD